MNGLNEGQVKEIVLRVLNGIAPEVDVATIEPTRDLRDQMDIDSVDFLNFVIGLHKELGIDIPDADLPKLGTMNGCVAYLASRVKSS
jgi:acyl carrier protein